jgi:hypothetical protein
VLGDAVSGGEAPVTIADLHAELTTLAKRRELRTLVVDVERRKGTFRWPFEDRFDTLTIEGRFWGLSDFKHKFGRIPHEHVTEWPRTICAAWRWIGDPKVQFAAEWDDAGPEGFARTMRDVMDQADIITGHYVNKADRRWLNSLFRDHGIDWPSPVKVVDTLTIARRDLGDESMTLDALCKRWGIPAKAGKYDANVADAACDGDRKAQREIRAYNMADVEASTGLYFKTLPLAHGHPHVAPVKGMDRTICPRCSSENVHRYGTWSPGTYVYAAYRCDDCPGTSHFRTVYEGRGPSVRAL